MKKSTDKGNPSAKQIARAVHGSCQKGINSMSGSPLVVLKVSSEIMKVKEAC